MDEKGIKAFETLYHAYADRLFRYFSLRMNNREKVVDMTQETFVRYWDKYQSQDADIENERSLLFTIAHNILVNSYERDRVYASVDSMRDDGIDIADTSGPYIEDKIDAQMAISLIDKLKPKYKEVLFFRFVEDMPIYEIARTIGETENVVSVRIHRGLDKLKKIYGIQ